MNEIRPTLLTVGNVLKGITVNGESIRPGDLFENAIGSRFKLVAITGEAFGDSVITLERMSAPNLGSLLDMDVDDFALLADRWTYIGRDDVEVKRETLVRWANMLADIRQTIGGEEFLALGISLVDELVRDLDAHLYPEEAE